MPEPPPALCACGCGQPTLVARWNNKRTGVKRGDRLRFLTGHSGNKGWKLDLEGAYTVDLQSGCWLWNRARSRTGYPIMGQAYANGNAHRWFYEQHVGPIPAGLHLDHLCRVRHCVNPAHLEPVTNAVNCRRGANAKIDEEVARAIKRDLADLRGRTLGSIAASYGVS